MNDWFNVTVDQFTDFRMLYQEINEHTDTTPSTTYPIPHLTQPNLTTTTTSNTLQQFTRCFKKDIKSFPKLKGSKHWALWYLVTKVQALIQDISKDIDTLYIPASMPDKILFNEKNVFMYAIFAEVLAIDGVRV